MVSLCWHLQVKKRTSSDNSGYGSSVMQYGDLKLSKDALYLYLGTNPANDNFTYVDDNSLRPSSKAVNQRDADLVHFWEKVCTHPSLNRLGLFILWPPHTFYFNSLLPLSQTKCLLNIIVYFFGKKITFDVINC